LPASALGDFVKSLARRIAGFPAFGLALIKERVNAVAPARAEDFVMIQSSSLTVCAILKHTTGSKLRRNAAFRREERKMALARMLGDLAGSA
jgi:hypothetical protein